MQCNEAPDIFLQDPESDIQDTPLFLNQMLSLFSSPLSKPGPAFFFHNLTLLSEEKP